jgi:two-component system, NtrC family, sensor kinase
MHEDPYSKLKRMILVIMILVPAIPFFLTLGIGYYYFADSIETATTASMKRIVEDHRQMIDTFLGERKADLEFLLNSFSYDELSEPQKLVDIFSQLQRQSNAFLDLGVFNEEGIHVGYQGPYKLIGKDYGKEEWFQHVLKEGYYISDVFLGFRQLPHFIIALTRESNGRRWVIRATIDTITFNEMVKKVRIGRTGEAYLVNNEGIFQSERRSGGALMEKCEEGILHPQDQGGIKISIQKEETEDTYLYATTWLKNKPWLLIVRQQENDAFKALRAASYSILFIVIIGGVLIVGTAFYITDLIVRRLNRMDRDKQQLSGQLIRATRLAEIGEMASGFAHEINNPLQIMMSEQALIDVLFSEIKEKGEIRESEQLTEIEDSMSQIKLQIQRCSKITQSILKFGRQGESKTTDIDLNAFFPEIIAMVERKASVQGIVIKNEIASNTPLLHGDSGQLSQVFINLFNNAIDSIVEQPGSKGGEIIIKTEPQEDGRVRISVSDNGIGISPENMKKVFTPFFTTKPVGKGTGLGLSVCYGIIDAMGGTMEVTSQRGTGTTFIIHLNAAHS